MRGVITTLNDVNPLLFRVSRDRGSTVGERTEEADAR